MGGVQGKVGGPVKGATIPHVRENDPTDQGYSSGGAVEKRTDIYFHPQERTRHQFLPHSRCERWTKGNERCPWSCANGSSDIIDVHLVPQKRVHGCH